MNSPIPISPADESAAADAAIPVPVPAASDSDSLSISSPSSIPDFPTSASSLSLPAVFSLLASHFTSIVNYFQFLTYNTNPLIVEYYPGLQNIKSSSNKWPDVIQLGAELIKLGQPIKCFESVILSIYFTESVARSIQSPHSFGRWIMRFQSHSENPDDTKFDYWHAIMVVSFNGKFGSLGFSRKESLGSRPLEFDSLSDLVRDYLIKYRETGHSVVCITLSSPLPDLSTPKITEFSLNWHSLVIRLAFASAIMDEMKTDSTRQFHAVLKWFELNSSLLHKPIRSSLPSKLLFIDSQTGKVRMKIPMEKKNNKIIHSIKNSSTKIISSSSAAVKMKSENSIKNKISIISRKLEKSSTINIENPKPKLIPIPITKLKPSSSAAARMNSSSVPVPIPVPVPVSVAAVSRLSVGSKIPRFRLSDQEKIQRSQNAV